MKKIALVFLCVLSINMLAQNDGDISNTRDLNNRTDSLNYFLGLTLGYSLETAPFETNAILISKGLAVVLEGKSEFDKETSKEIFQALHTAMIEEEDGIIAPEERENRDKGIAFLAENSKKEGITTTASGLQYKVLTLGNGPKPTAESTVKVHYEGSLIDGTVFDSSYKRGQPISFPLSKVIAGWTEGLQIMRAGSVYIFYIPSDLAYGEKAAGSIPPFSVMIFKVELLGIE